MRADFDALIGHDQRAIQQGKIADFAAATFAESEGDPGVTRNVRTQLERGLVFAPEKPKDLRGLDVQPFTPNDIAGDGMGPPIVLDATIRSNIAHGFTAIIELFAGKHRCIVGSGKSLRDVRYFPP
jgi:hypothetical protein